MNALLSVYPPTTGTTRLLLPPLGTSASVSAGSGAEGTTETALWAVQVDGLIAPSMIVLDASGFLNHNSTIGSPTLTMRLRFGGITGTVLMESIGLDPGASVTSRFWRVIAQIGIQSVGASGAAMPNGLLVGFTQSSSLLQVRSWNTNAANAPNTAISINTTSPASLVLSAKYSAEAASNAITITNAICYEAR